MRLLLLNGNTTAFVTSVPGEQARRASVAATSVTNAVVLPFRRSRRMGGATKAWRCQPKERRGSQSAISGRYIIRMAMPIIAMKKGRVPRNTSLIEPSRRTAWIT